MSDEESVPVCNEDTSNEEKLEDLKNKIKGGDDDLDKHVKDYINLYLDINGHPEKNFEGAEDISNLAEEISDSLDYAVPANIIREHLEAKIHKMENSCIDPSEKSIHEAVDPIMMFNGQFVHECIDLKINGAGMDFIFKRIYKNQANYDGPLGYNWDHNYNLWLRISNQTIFRSTGEHREDIYKKHPIYDYWMPPNGQHSIIIKVGLFYECKMPNGIRYVYTQHPDYPFLYVISKIEDKFDNFIEFQYNPDRELEFIKINNDHRLVKFIYDEHGRIINLIDYTKEFNPLGRRWIYTYDYFGDLISVTTTPTDRYPEGLTTIYEYSSSSYPALLQHNLTRIIDPVGQIYLENEYGTEFGYLSFNRIIRQWQGNGESYISYDNIIDEFEFEYSDIERPAYQTNFIDTNGHPIHYIYNKYGNLLLKEEYIFQNGVNQLLRWRYRYNLDGEVIGVLTPEGTLNQFFYGRDYYMRKFPPVFELEIDYNHLTINERLRFGNLLVTVRRGVSYNIEMMDLSKGVWSNFIFPEIISVKNRADIIQKYSYEDEHQQLLTSSDPRFTISTNPDDKISPAEHTRYEETLINYKYNSITGALEAITYPDTHLPDGSVLNSIEAKFPDYDKNGRLLKSIDPEGIITKYEYFDSSYNIKEGYLKRKIIDLGGLNLTVEYEVNEVGIPTMITKPNAFLAVPGPIGYFRDVFSINALDQTIQIINSKPYEYKTKLFYDRNNQLEKEERELRDEAGSIILDGWEVKVYKYDEQLNLTEKTIGGLNLSEHLKTKYIYNHSGKLSKTVFPKGNEIFYEYEERHLQTRIIRGNDSPDSAKVQSYYNGNGLRIEIVDGLDNITHYNYDEFNRTKEIIDAEGNIERIDYDKANNVICRRLFELKSDGSYTLLSRVEFTYDELNRMIFESKNLFQVPLSATNLDTDFLASPGPGTTIKTQFFYDKKGRLKKIINSENQKIDFSYDNADRKEIEKDELGNYTHFQYDLNGNLIRQDIHEQVIDMTTSIVIRENIFTKIYRYDELDRKVDEIDSLGNKAQFFYNSLGNLTKRIDSLGNTIRYEYDIFGNKRKEKHEITDTGIGAPTIIKTLETQFEYDLNGNLTKTINPKGVITTNDYDNLNRICLTEFPDLTTIEISYDKNDNILSYKDNKGIIKLYKYNKLNNIKRLDIDTTSTVAGASIEGATFEEYIYDGLQRKINIRNDFQTLSNSYDSLGRIYEENINFHIAIAPFLGNFQILREFNTLGDLKSITYPSGRKIQYYRNKIRQLFKIENIDKGAHYNGSTEFPPKYNLLELEYEGLRSSKKVYGNKASTTYKYDKGARLIQIEDYDSSSSSVLKNQYLFDAVDNMRFKNEIYPARNEGYKYKYNSKYWLTKIEPKVLPVIDPKDFEPMDHPLPLGGLNGQQKIDVVIGSLVQDPADYTFKYDDLGNREEEVTTIPSIINYIPNDLNQTEKKDTTIYAYDQNGNLRNDSRYNYFYNYRNQIVRVYDSGLDKDIALYLYDSSGRRIFSKTNTEIIHFLYNDINLIEEYHSNKLYAQYVYEKEIDSLIQIVVNNHEYWYHKDIVNSVRFLTDEVGKVSGEYHYTSFGKLITSRGPYNPYKFNGRRYDEEINSYDFRLRQYLPDLGKFFQRDKINSLNSYIFLENNPLTGIDPMGLEHSSSVRASESPTIADELVQNRELSEEEMLQMFPVEKLRILKLGEDFNPYQHWFLEKGKPVTLKKQHELRRKMLGINIKRLEEFKKAQKEADKELNEAWRKIFDKRSTKKEKEEALNEIRKSDPLNEYKLDENGSTLWHRPKKHRRIKLPNSRQGFLITEDDWYIIRSEELNSIQINR